MADYLYIPRVTDVATEGIVIYSYMYPQTGDTKIGYIADTNYSIKIGLYQTGVRDRTWVIASDDMIVGIDIQAVSFAGVTLFEVHDIIAQYDSGYYVTVPWQFPENVVVSVPMTTFNSLGEVLESFGDGEPPVSVGVEVTVIASPVDIPPGEEGVVVTVIGRRGDPSTQGGTSTTGGGGGTFDDTSDTIPNPSLPSISASQSGLVTMFRPTLVELRNLGAYLWTNLTDFIENLNKLFVNPMDYLISLNILPCIPEVGTSRPIKIGNFTTEINMSPVLNQFFELNCGRVRIDEYWGSALDYSPYTKISIFLPFIGSVPLDTDEIMGEEIGLRYKIDLLSGKCLALIFVNDDLYYQYAGDCSIPVPLTGSDWSRIYSAGFNALGNLISGASSLMSTVASTPIPDITPTASPSTHKELISGIKELGGRAVTNEALSSAEMQGSASNGMLASRAVDTIAGSIPSVLSGKLMIQHSGSMSGSISMLGNRLPYIAIEYPEQSLPESYAHLMGYPSNITYKLNELHGYTEITQILISISGTDNELSELLKILKQGVYL